MSQVAQPFNTSCYYFCSWQNIFEVLAILREFQTLSFAVACTERRGAALI
jgi:hypothetical protein